MCCTEHLRGKGKQSYLHLGKQSYLLGISAKQCPDKLFHFQGCNLWQGGQFLLPVAPAFEGCFPAAVEWVTCPKDLVCDRSDCPDICFGVIDHNAWPGGSGKHLWR